MFTTLLLSVVISNSPAWARGTHPSECDARLTSLMEHTYCTPSLYWRGRCGDNVTNLVREAGHWGIDLHGAEVLVLQHESRMVPPVPVPFDYPLEPAPAPARGRPSQWKFHVILALVRDGRSVILDLDFAERPVDADAYFNEMFPARDVHANFQSKDRLAGIYLRRVALPEYLDTHARLGGDDAAVHYREKKNLISARAFIEFTGGGGVRPPP